MVQCINGAYGDLPHLSIEVLRRLHKTWVEEALARSEHVLAGKWTESYL